MMNLPYAAGREDRPYATSSGHTFWFGPFQEGSEVSFEILARFRHRLNSHGGFGTVERAPSGFIIPGIVPDFRMDEVISQYDASDPSQDSMLSFPFPDFEMELGEIRTVTRAVNDPRLKRPDDWILRSDDAFVPDTFPSGIYTGGSADSLASDISRANSTIQHVRGRMRNNTMVGGEVSQADYSTSSRILGTPGVGYFSSISTGINRGIPWQTMNFGVAGTAPVDDPPDWLLWSLMYLPFDRSHANNTDGRININATLFPFEYEGQPLRRIRPLAALLGERVSSADDVAKNIAEQRLVAGAAPLVGPTGMYVYPGEICQIQGVADVGENEFQRESVSRDVADIITTQSSDFRVFAVGQTLRLRNDGSLMPVSTRRVEAVLSRLPDTGFQQYPFGLRDGHASTYDQVPENSGASVSMAFVRRDSYRNWLDGGRTTAMPNLLRISTTTQSRDWVNNSHYGRDRIPNTADDPLILQRIQISNIRSN